MSKYWDKFTEREQQNILRNVSEQLLNAGADFCASKKVSIALPDGLDVILHKNKISFVATVDFADLPLRQKKYMDRMIGFMSRGRIIDFDIKRVKKPEVPNA